MKVKRYFGTNLQEAMQRARLDLGDNILLVDTNSIPLKKQGDQLETLTQITVAIPDGELPKPKARNATKTIPYTFKDYLRREEAAHSNPVVESGPIGTAPKTPPVWGKQRPAANNHILPPALITLFDRLVRVGVAANDADYIIKQVFIKTRSTPNLSMADYSAAIKAEVINTFDYYQKVPANHSVNKRVIALIGATGAGKSSILMKMATHPRLFKNKKVALVTTDNYRMGAKQALQTFSNIAQIPLLEAYDASTLKSVLAPLLKAETTVLIDTPGRSPFFPHFFHELQDLLNGSGEVAKIELVISAATDLEDIVLNMSLWSLLEPAGMIITKLDETSRPGKTLSLVRAFELPIHFISDGQRIPQDIYPGKGALIWEKIEKIW